MQAERSVLQLAATLTETNVDPLSALTHRDRLVRARLVSPRLRDSEVGDQSDAVAAIAMEDRSERRIAGAPRFLATTAEHFERHHEPL